MVDRLNPQSEFEKSITSIVSLLVSQVKEVKVEHNKLDQSLLFRDKKIGETMDELALSVVQSEQYTRRDTLIQLLSLGYHFLKVKPNQNFVQRLPRSCPRRVKM